MTKEQIKSDLRDLSERLQREYHTPEATVVAVLWAAVEVDRVNDLCAHLQPWSRRERIRMDEPDGARNGEATETDASKSEVDADFCRLRHARICCELATLIEAIESSGNPEVKTWVALIDRLQRVVIGARQLARTADDVMYECQEANRVADMSAPSDGRILLSYGEAVAMLPDKDRIHVIRTTADCLLLGATWSREDVVEALKAAKRIQRTVFKEVPLDHGLCINDDQPLFIETKPNLKGPPC